MSKIKGYHHVSLSVTHLSKSSEWYRGVFGLDIDAEIEGESFRRIRLRAPESGLTLTLTAHHEVKEVFSERRPGLDHVCFELSDGHEISALKRRFEQLGVSHSDIKTAASGSAIISLRDPDNIQLEVFGAAFGSSSAAGRPGA